ncbi:rho GDP-dissociation inhibitor 1-like [Andrographis paniculata]|uniref:rho GDP-dissociation inhibitor 1-like n=1 Tax=Andrographis paniculata TaxID=175694 RepID=UPI0021E80155|nr:rho GDP-dissociation inhibitor 1-like [Andrographis paniculata]
MGFEEKEGKAAAAESESETETERISRNQSESSLTTEDDDDDEVEIKIQLGPQYTLKELSEKDKDDESLRKWKEQLLGSVDVASVGDTLDAEVKILNLTIKAWGRDDIVLPIPEDKKPKSPWFTLKVGSTYSLKFAFKVSNNIVSGLKYKNTVWKTGIKVDSTKEMIGTFSPQPEPYTHEMPEDTTPSGMFARGIYSAKTQFLDDDNKCYLDLEYSFEIKKEWPSQ